MNSRVFLTACQRARLSLKTTTLAAPIQRRLASSQPQQPSPLAQFYKDFTRPVAKVLLMAMFTYQLAYWGWVKLEQDEIIHERQGEIARLEAEVKKLTRKSSA